MHVTPDRASTLKEGGLKEVTRGSPTHQQLYPQSQVLSRPPTYTGTIGVHRGVEVVFNFNNKNRLIIMVSTRNDTNNDRMANEQIAVIRALQAQMEELRQKGIEE